MARALILGLVAALVSASPVLADITGTARVIDGDTIDVAGERIRLHGIDAPEARQTCIADERVWQCGKRATAALAAFIGGAPVSCRAQGEDRYGRTVAVCVVLGQDLGAWLVRNGWAIAYRRFSLVYIGDETEARAAQAGIWRGAVVLPWEWRKGLRIE